MNIQDLKKVELLLSAHHIELLIGLFRGLSLNTENESDKEIHENNYDILINLIPIDKLPETHEQILFLEEQYRLAKMGMSPGQQKISEGFENIAEEFKKFKDE